MQIDLIYWYTMNGVVTYLKIDVRNRSSKVFGTDPKVMGGDASQIKKYRFPKGVVIQEII